MATPKELATQVADMLNVMGTKNKEEFIRQMNREHRFLQEEFTGLCLAWLQNCAKDSYGYDPRNEHSHRYSKALLEKGLL